MINSARSGRWAAAVLIGAGALGIAAPAIAAPTEPTNSNVGAYCEEGGDITGAGASFARLAHEDAFKPAYADDCGKGTITYNSVGSGKGRAAICSRNVAFGGSDEPLDDGQKASFEAGDCDGDGIAESPGPSEIHQIPIALGAITVSYNACGAANEAVNLTSKQVSDIFAGTTTNWSQVPGAGCDQPITRVVRSDVSGTTYAFKDYLSKRNSEWVAYNTPATNTQWPAGSSPLERGNGNGEVATKVKSTPGAIGYVVLSDARAQGLTWAKVDGPNGTFREPDLGAGPGANCEASAADAALPASTLDGGWHEVSITDSTAGYPICTFTYALAFDNLVTAQTPVRLGKAETQTLVDYLSVAVDDLGQSRLAANDYGRLPANVQALAKEGIAGMVGLP